MRTCKKIGFDTEHQAKIKRLEIQLEGNKHATKTIKRAYKCVLCDKWHLTSMDTAQFAVVVENRENREKAFLFKEAKYWSKKFGVDFEYFDVYNTAKDLKSYNKFRDKLRAKKKNQKKR